MLRPRYWAPPVFSSLFDRMPKIEGGPGNGGADIGAVPASPQYFSHHVSWPRSLQVSPRGNTIEDSSISSPCVTERYRVIHLSTSLALATPGDWYETCDATEQFHSSRRGLIRARFSSLFRGRIVAAPPLSNIPVDCSLNRVTLVRHLFVHFPTWDQVVA